MTLTRYCPACWAENPYGAERCARCGQPLRDDPQTGYASALVRALRHPEEWTARRAAWLLGQVGRPEDVPQIVEALEQVKDPYVLAEAAVALGKIGNPEAIPALERLLDAGPLPARAAAARALGAFEGPAARQALERALDDPNQLVRQEALRSLDRAKARRPANRSPDT